MKQKEFVFPEYDRLWPMTVIGTAITNLVLLTFIFMMEISSGFNLTILWILWGTIAVICVLVPAGLLLRDCGIRPARFQISDDSVQMQFGRTRRQLKTGDDVHIALKKLALGDKNTPIQKPYYILWREGAETPGDFSRPFHTLKKNEMIALPFDEEVRRKLCVLFGKREALAQDVNLENDMKYVFSDGQQLLAHFCSSVSLFAYLFLLSVYAIIWNNYRGSSSLILSFMIWNAVCIVVLIVLINAFKSIKYRFIRYQFSEDAILYWVGKEKRVICSSDNYKISLRTLEFGGRYSASRTMFIALWKSVESEPKDKVGAYYFVKHYKTIALPDSEEVRSQLKRTLGVEAIGYWVTSPK